MLSTHRIGKYFHH